MGNKDAVKPKHTTAECNGVLSIVEDALYVIGGKWKLKIIISLADGGRRFNELQRTVTGISARVLSNELKDLELNGFVKRNVSVGPPVITEYELTGYSHTLDTVIDSLRQWGTMHRAKLMKREEENAQV
jgi:DNA-binding HxlR family transcriptional regulator